MKTSGLVADVNYTTKVPLFDSSGVPLVFKGQTVTYKGPATGYPIEDSHIFRVFSEDGAYLKDVCLTPAQIQHLEKS